MICTRSRLRAGSPLAILLLAFAAAACNPITDNLGNRTLKENVEQIQVGRTTKAEVVRLLGSPSNVAAFDPNTWYYISARQVQYAFLKPRIAEQHVLKIRFDGSGVVAETKQLGIEDAQATTYVDRTTPTRGGEPGVLRSMYDTLMRGPINGSKTAVNKPRGPDY
jgi:outer membrane protein assembly factor BamE (lipoprotein component of BamABCDE complex)